MKLSKRVKLVTWKSKSGNSVKLGLRVDLPDLHVGFKDREDGTVTLPEYGALAEAPTFSIVHFQDGRVAVKLNDNWVFVFADTYAHVSGGAHFVGFMRYASCAVDCVWAE